MVIIPRASTSLSGFLDVSTDPGVAWSVLRRHDARGRAAGDPADGSQLPGRLGSRGGTGPGRRPSCRTGARREHDRGDRRDLRHPVRRHPADRIAECPGSAGDHQLPCSRWPWCSGAACPDRVSRVVSAGAGRSSPPSSRSSSSPAEVFVDPSVAKIDRAGGVVARVPRGRDRLGPGRPAARRLRRAVGHRHVDDPAHRRRQAHAGPAADRPAGREDRPRGRLRDGLGVPRRAQCRPDHGGGGAGPVGAEDVPRLLPGRGCRPRGPERPGDHHRRPEPPGADRSPLRHHHHRPAAADRERRGLGHLLAASTTRPGATT